MEEYRDMKKAAAALIILLLLVITACASAVELAVGKIRAFDSNILCVNSEEGGRLTIEAWVGTLQIKNPVTDLQISAGLAEIPWDGLGYGGEPVPVGTIRLRATLACRDRTTEQTETEVYANAPLTAVVSCLPAAQSYYPNRQNPLKIEVALSGAGLWEAAVTPAAQPGETVWHTSGRTDGQYPVVLRWNGMQNGKPCEPGKYVISAWSKACPERIHTATVTLLSEPMPEPELAPTGKLIPDDLSDDKAVWEALTAPVVVGVGSEGGGLPIMPEKGARTERLGTVTCRTAGVEVLEIDGGWVRIGAWQKEDNRYTEGWVRADKLQVIRPNGKYGAVVDKKAQTMTIYEDGKKLGTILISTGYEDAQTGKAFTRPGAYLMGTRMEDFAQSGHIYCYPVRIDGGNLIHQSGYFIRNRARNYEEEISTLGTKASHGCIRMDPRATEENGFLNAWWVWTHMGHDTKIIVTADD